MVTSSPQDSRALSQLQSDLSRAPTSVLVDDLQSGVGPHTNETNGDDKTDHEDETDEDEKDEAQQIKHRQSQLEQANSIEVGILQLESDKRDLKRSFCCSSLIFSIVMVFILFYFWYNCINNITLAMNVTLSSINEHVITTFEFEFYIPQTILQIMIGGLETGDIPIDASIMNGSYDQYFASLLGDSSTPTGGTAHAMHSVFVYNVNESIMMGAYRNGTNSDELISFDFNKTCLNDYIYDRNNSVRTNTNVYYDCTYKPKTRDWYKTVPTTEDMQQWTEPYPFILGSIGLSLSQRIVFDEIEFVFVVEFTVSSVQSLIDKFNVPLDGQLYIVTKNYSLLAGSRNGDQDIELIHEIGQYHNYTGTYGGNDTDETIVIDLNFGNFDKYSFNLNFLQNERNEQLAAITPFEIIRGSWDRNYANEQNGFIIIVYSDAYKYYLYYAFIGTVLSWVCGIMALICTNLSRIDITVGIKLKYTLYIVCTFVTISYGWWIVAIYRSNVQLLHDTMMKQEHLHVVTKVNQLFELGKFSLDIMKQRFLNDNFKYIYDNNSKIIDFDNTDYGYDKFFINFRNANQRGNRYRDTSSKFLFYATYIGFPNGGIFGTVVNTSNNDDSVIVVARSGDTNWTFNYYGIERELTTQNDTNYVYIRDENATLGQSSWFEPRCREWYIKPISYGFDGSLKQLFPYTGINDGNNRGSYSYWYSNKNEGTYTFDGCENARAEYDELFDVQKNCTGTEDDRECEYSSNVVIDKNYDIFWSQYTFVTEIVGVTVSMALQNEKGDLVAVISCDYALDYISSFLTDSIRNDDKLGAKQSNGWIFDSDSAAPSVIASSDGKVTYKFDDGFSGTVCDNDDTVVPHTALNHPNHEISKIAQVLIDKFGLDNIEINHTDSETIYITIELPTIEASRVQFWPGFVIFGSNDTNSTTTSNYTEEETLIGIDWTIITAIDLSDYDKKIKILYIFTLIVVCSLLLVLRICLNIIENWKTLGNPGSSKNKKQNSNVNINNANIENVNTVEDFRDLLQQLSENSQMSPQLQQFIAQIRSQIPTQESQLRQYSSHMVRFKFQSKEIKHNQQVQRQDSQLEEKDGDINDGGNNCVNEMNPEMIEGKCKKVVSEALIQLWIDYLQLSRVVDRMRAVTMDTVDKFLIQLARTHLEYFNDYSTSSNSLKLDKNFIFDNCYLRSKSKFKLKYFLNRFSQKSYHLLIELTIVLHILIACWHGKKEFSLIVTIVNLVCTLIEVFDLVIEFAVRWIRLIAHHNTNTTNNNPNHDPFAFSLNNLKLMFMSKNTQRLRFSLRLIMTFLVLSGVILCNIPWGNINWYYDANLYFYAPLVPLLLVLKSDNIFESSKEFVQALAYGKQVLFGYLCFVLMASIFGMAILQDSLNTDSIIHSFIYLPEALMLCFILITTQENYNDAIYPALKHNKLSLCYYFTFIVIGIFIAIPYLISQFEELFIQERIRLSQKKKHEKIHSIVAAFVVLKPMNDEDDINNNNNGGISEKQCKTLLNEMNNYNVTQTKEYCQIMSDLVKYDVYNDNNYSILSKRNQNLTLKNFVGLMLNFLMHSKEKEVETINTNKWQARLECNLFRQGWMQYVTLFCAILPGLTVASMYGLFEENTTEIKILDTILTASFVYNILEIGLKMYAFGWKLHVTPRYNTTNQFQCFEWPWKYRLRYFHFDFFRDPPLVAYKCEHHKMMNDFVFISNSDRKWADKYLNACPKLTIVEKKKVSIVLEFDFAVCMIGLIGLIYQIGYYVILNGFEQSGDINSFEFKSIRLWLEIPLLRLFTIIANRRLVFIFVTVVWQLSSIIIVSLLITYIFACIGFWSFHGKSKLVTSTIYETTTDANFDNLLQSLLALMQIFIGEGWHDVLFLNVLTANFPYLAALYFVAYVVVITIILNSIFIGAVLAGVKQMSNY